MAGLSETIPLLLTARVIQGVAMGGLTALAQAIIGSMIPPRDRGKYSGYMGAVMAVGTAGGPLLGGFIVDSPLGWRWTFFVCVPLAVVALILLQVTLKIQHIKRPAKIDWLGSILLTSGVSLLLIWVSFAGNPDYYDWFSWQSAAMVGGGVVLLALLVLVESKVEQPIIPLKIISERTTALAILASVAVGVAHVRLLHLPGPVLPGGPRRHPHRGRAPDPAHDRRQPDRLRRVGPADQPHRQMEGLPDRRLHPADRRPGRSPEPWTTPPNCGRPAIFTAVLGLGLGMLMQNLVLAVQNTVRATDIGTASASVAFFRSVGGAIGVSVLGAVLAAGSRSSPRRAWRQPVSRCRAARPGPRMDLVDMPAPVRDIMRAAYGDATAEIFLISAGVAVVALLSVLFIKERPLRRTVDIQPDVAPDASAESATPELVSANR